MRSYRFRAFYRYSDGKHKKTSVTCDGDMPINDVFYLNQKENIVFSQFIGLYDKNGKEIYEGDIIKTETFVGKVLFSASHHSYILRWVEYDGFIPQDEDLEIIGNVYENPELLEAET